MKSIFDKAELGIPCPGCGHQTKKSVAWIKANDSMICEGCGATVTLERDKLLEGLAKADKSISGLFKKR